jgi:ubiquinone/menaquinone biosynthesis C-methylase UbiE
MSLASEYAQQRAWRDWPTVLEALPSLKGQTVFDLGCGRGDLAATLVERGAHVVGFDTNEELLAAASSRQLLNAEFRKSDLRSFGDPGLLADGLWCSFTAAYFPDLTTMLTIWTANLRPGGWIALTEVDDMFSHEPLSDRTKTLLSGYAADSLASGRYHFSMGRELRTHLERCGFDVLKELILQDQELSFDGAARPDVLCGWRARFERMSLLRAFCGVHFEQVREEFLSCLMRADHRSLAKVNCCIATKTQSRG